jgi:hypothetical protein
MQNSHEITVSQIKQLRNILFQDFGSLCNPRTPVLMLSHAFHAILESHMISKLENCVLSSAQPFSPKQRPCSQSGKASTIPAQFTQPLELHLLQASAIRLAVHVERHVEELRVLS